MKVIFQAEDGTIFDSQEECNVYEESPRVYIIHGAYHNVHNVFLSYDDAKKMCESLNNLSSVYAYYYIKSYELSHIVGGDIKFTDKVDTIPKNIFQKLKEDICGKSTPAN